MPPTVTRSETTTARFGRVVTYRVKIGDVTVTAERMVGASDFYSLSSHVGRCGMSHVSYPLQVKAGRGVSAAVLDAAQKIVKGGLHVKEHALCCDPAACKQAASA